MFLGYSSNTKAYKCLNLATHKVIESVHLKIDEFVEKSEEKSSKRPKEYRNFVYYELDTIPKTQATMIRQKPCQPPNLTIQLMLYPVQPKLHPEATESQIVQTKSQIEECESHSMGIESQIAEIEQNLEIHKTFEHGEPSESNIESRNKIPILDRYVRRHHVPKKIIGDQTKGTIIRNKLNDTCFLTKFEPITSDDALRMKFGKKHSFLGRDQYLGQAKSRIASLNLQQKINMQLQQLIAST